MFPVSLCRAIGILLFLMLFPPAEVGATEVPAPIAPRAPAPRMPSVAPSDSIDNETFRGAHAFSLDHFLENVGGYLLSRVGAVGAETGFSRFGMGAGRCLVLLDGVPVNNPGNDRAPLVLLPTTSIGSLGFGRSGAGDFYEGLEGTLSITSPAAPETRPEAVIELSKGNKDLKQRRVRFSSVQSTIGIDLAYDELLNDGYQYYPYEDRIILDLGRFSSRVYSLRARGKLSGTDEYSISLRHFTSDFEDFDPIPRYYALSFGDTVRLGRSLHRKGHIAVASANIGYLHLRAYTREFDTAYSDSSGENSTIGVLATTDIPAIGGMDATITTGVENIAARQEIRQAVSNKHLNKLRLGVTAARSGRYFNTRLDAGLQHQFSYATGWGGSVALERRLNSRHNARVSLARSFRLPNLGELFMPLHESRHLNNVFFSGDENLTSEYAYEATAVLSSRVNRIQNEFGVTMMRVADPVLPVSTVSGGETIWTFRNAEEETVTLVSDRIAASRSIAGTRVKLGGGVVYASGDRERYLASVPKTRIDATLSLGRVLFRPSTDMVLTAQYQYSSSRRFGMAEELPSYQVLNLKLDVRLLDAHLYLLWLNVTDKEYQTQGPFLMTPKTLVYGVEWTIFG